jgi:N-acetylmuramoyl-L-alanine amidase
MLDETLPPTVFVELGNIQHDRDKERVLVPNNRQAVANWMAGGILADVKQRE